MTHTTSWNCRTTPNWMPAECRMATPSTVPGGERRRQHRPGERDRPRERGRGAGCQKDGPDPPALDARTPSAGPSTSTRSRSSAPPAARAGPGPHGGKPQRREEASEASPDNAADELQQGRPAVQVVVAPEGHQREHEGDRRAPEQGRACSPPREPVRGRRRRPRRRGERAAAPRRGTNRGGGVQPASHCIQRHFTRTTR